jgi:outer membrane protein assembly factor BamB
MYWFIFFSVFLIITYNLPAQPLFQYAIGMEGFEKANTIKPLVEGGYIIAGETESYGLTQRDMLLLKTDADGNVLWTSSFGGPEREVLNDVIQLPDKGFLLIAEKYQPDRQEGEFLTLIKTDENGNIVWKKIFDEGGNETEGFTLQATRDNGYIIAGMTKKLTTVSNTFFTMRAEEDQNVYLLKTDANGNKIWSKRLDYGTDNTLSTATSVIVAKDGSYIITGNIGRKGGTDKKIEKPARQVNPLDLRNVLLLKVKPNGALQWSYEYEANKIMMGYVVAERKEGGYIIAGNALLSDSNLDIFLMSVTANGHVEWTKTYGGGKFESVSDMILLADGNIVVTGITESFGSGASDVLLFKTDTKGNVLWSKTYGGKSEEYPSKLALTPNGFIITGATASFKSESFDVLLIKTDENGNSNCALKEVSLQVNMQHVVAKKPEQAELKKVEQGIFPPNVKKPDSSNIIQTKREICTRKWCEQSK